MANTNQPTQSEMERQHAIKYNKQVWDLLGKADRNEQDDALMIHAAHCSYLYWLNAGTELNHQRGAWLLSRVYSEVGDGELALYFAGECHRLTQEHPAQMQDFDFAYAEESLARANAVLHNFDEAEQHYQLALTAAEQVASEGDRELVLEDLSGGAWGGFKITA
ncbi:MAG: hypothetical protein ACE5Q6_20375 [Dehalococcoidia bacterium]